MPARRRQQDAVRRQLEILLARRRRGARDHRFGDSDARPAALAACLLIQGFPATSCVAGPI